MPIRVVRGLHNVSLEDQGCVCTVGTFDGVHKGHQELLRELVAHARRLKTRSLVILFEPHPNEFFRTQPTPARLTTLVEKLILLEKLHVDAVLCLPFNEQTQTIPAIDFIKQIFHRRLAIQHLVVGHDFRFGHRAEGNVELIESFANMCGFGVSQVSQFRLENEGVSSTLVRQVLWSSQFERARSLLGRHYSMAGKVSPGRKIGRGLGVPTANIPLARIKAPLEGIFAVSIEGLNKIYTGAGYIGPTAHGTHPLLEVHLLGWSGNLYQRRLRINFHAKIRDDQYFDDLEALKIQMRVDIQKIRAWFDQHPQTIDTIQKL